MLTEQELDEDFDRAFLKGYTVASSTEGDRLIWNFIEDGSGQIIVTAYSENEVYQLHRLIRCHGKDALFECRGGVWFVSDSQLHKTREK